MSLLTTVCYIGMAATSLTLVLGLTSIVRSTDFAVRVVLADLVFYSMLAIYLMWCLINRVSISYEVITLAAVMGIISTLSLARILSQGRR